MILTAAVDAHVQEGTPKTNWGSSSTLWVNGGAGSNDARAFIFFPRVFPNGSTILSATLKVRVFNPAAVLSGAYEVNVLRVTEPWNEGKVTWANQPAAGGSPVSVSKTTPIADKTVYAFDVKDHLQAAAGGSPFYGFRLGLTQDKDFGLRSAEDPVAALRPTLEITWSEAPNAPDRLVPDGGQATGTAFPILSWRFSDPAGNQTQFYSQVQINDTSDFSSPDYDSTKTANAGQYWDTDDGVFTGISNGETKYWRVKVWDGTDFESPWSAVASFSRVNAGTLNITSPGATVDETTPAVEWTITGGEPQDFYRVTLFEVLADGSVTELWVTSGAGTTDSVEVPSGLVRTGHAYRVRVEAWDDADRFADEHLTDEQDFTYARSGAPAAVTSLAADTTPGSAEVLLTWDRAVEPDYFALRVDGEEVLDRIIPAEVAVGGAYQLGYWRATPRQAHTFEVEAVEQASPGDPLLHSDGNATASATTEPLGVWLADEADGLAVQIAGKEDNELEVDESAETFLPLGGQVPVRVVDTVRGYRGEVKGVLLGADARDDFMELRSREKELVLVLGDLALPVRLEGGTATPTPLPGDVVYSVSFPFFQVGPPWPVREP